MTEPKQADSEILVRGSMLEYFKDALSKSLRRQNVQLNEITEFYISNLLAGFAQADAMYTKGADEPRQEPTLALLYHEAALAERPQKIAQLKKLGDVSLYLSGFFPDSVQRRGVDLEYYVTMGEGAYASLSSLMSEPSGAKFGTVYSELAEKFKRLVDILNEIAESGQLANPCDILKVYERWLGTGSQRLYEKLVAGGLIPVRPAPPLN